MLSFDFRNRNRWVRVKNYWPKNTHKKDKSKHSTGEVKSGRKQVDPGTYFFCIQRTRRCSVSSLARAVQNCLPPCVIDHKSPKLFLWPTLLCSPLYKGLDIAHYFSCVEKSGVYLFHYGAKGNQKRKSVGIGNAEFCRVSLWNGSALGKWHGRP